MPNVLGKGCHIGISLLILPTIIDDRERTFSLGWSERRYQFGIPNDLFRGVLSVCVIPVVASVDYRRCWTRGITHLRAERSRSPHWILMRFSTARHDRRGEQLTLAEIYSGAAIRYIEPQ